MGQLDITNTLVVDRNCTRRFPDYMPDTPRRLRSSPDTPEKTMKLQKVHLECTVGAVWSKRENGNRRMLQGYSLQRSGVTDTA